MSILETKANGEGQSFREKVQAWNELLKTHEDRWEVVKSEGLDKYKERHKKAGKFLARERVLKLLDKGSDFLELMPFAGLDQKEMTPGGSIVGGIGKINGKYCVINANVPTLKGGALNQSSLLKSQRLDVIARENKLPVVYLTESAGADLPQQALVYNYGGATFREISRRSKLGIPSVTIVFGNSTAGGAYIPGMSDYVIMVKNQAKVFLAGPPLVKMATKEETDHETLGGAEMHSKVSGVSDFLAEDEEEAIELARDIVGGLKTPVKKEVSKDFKEPRYDMGELLGIVPTDIRRPFDAREVLARVLDDSDFVEFKKHYGPTLVTGFGKIHGHEVGIIANNGVLFSEASQKGAQFIQLCNQDHRPIIFLQNITGFMVGKKVEQEGIIKNGAKMINAVSNSTVPMITILMGASYGAGNYAMCGRAYEPRFLFAWPNSKLAVMGGEQLAGVMEIIRRDAAEKSGKPVNEEEIEMVKKATIQQIDKESEALFASSRVWDDGIIDPRDTRSVLATCLEVINENDYQSDNRFGVFRM